MKKQLLVLVSLMAILVECTGCMMGSVAIPDPPNTYSPNYQFRRYPDGTISDPADIAQVIVMIPNDTQFLIDVSVNGIPRGRVEPGGVPFRFFADAFTRSGRQTVLSVKVVQPLPDGRILVHRSFTHSLGYMGVNGRTTVIWKITPVRSWGNDNRIDFQEVWETTQDNSGNYYY